jgi:hypothetical protein
MGRRTKVKQGVEEEEAEERR